MGFSASTSHMILFVAALIVASSVAGIFTKSVFDISGGISERNDRLYMDLKTDIKIINDPGNVPNDPLIIFIKNTGESQLDGSQIQILIDGYLLDDSEYSQTVMDENSYWNTSTVLQVTVNGGSFSNLSAGDHYIKVVIYSSSDRMNFRIG